MEKRKKSLRTVFMQNVRTGRSMLTKEKSVQLLEKLHVRIAEEATRIRQENQSDAGQGFPPGQEFLSGQGFLPGQELLPGQEFLPGQGLPPGQQRSIRQIPVWLKWSAAAAIILLLAGAPWLYHRSRNNTAVAGSPLTAPPPVMTVRANNGDRVLTLTLPDQSSVSLFPGSSIHYYAFFEPGQRNIHLSGMAIFEVAGDAARPFTVYAGDISTTALGTRFMVSTLMTGKVRVRLLEGKVVVRPSTKELALKDVYLLPGQQFEMDRQQRQFAVTEYKDSNHLKTQGLATAKTKLSLRRNLLPTAILEFNQEPLAGVLKKISLRYGVPFRLEGHGFNTLQVTGKFLPTDSLQSVLSMLGSINHLSFTEKNDTLVVTRMQ